MSKSISLTFRGFDVSPQDVQLAVGIDASCFGHKGDPVKPGVRSLLKRPYVQFSLDFPGNCRLEEIVSTFLSHLGGVSHLDEVRKKVNPEFFELDLVLPIKGSEEQEGGLLSQAVIEDLYLLKVSLSFQFL